MIADTAPMLPHNVSVDPLYHPVDVTMVTERCSKDSASGGAPRVQLSVINVSLFPGDGYNGISN